MTEPEPLKGATRVALLSHSQPRNTGDAVAEAVAAAREAGVELLAEPGELADGVEPAGVEIVDALPAGLGLCLALGGDGTILRALRRFAGTGTPVFGINYGTVGFLAATESEELQTGLQQALTGQYEVVPLPGLDVVIDGRRQIAVNDVSFTRRPHHRVAELSYSVGGSEVGSVRCDGLVAATPAGSTGYNLANNGPILAWGVEGYVVSFVAPHTLTARALVVAPGDVLHVANVAEVDPVEIALDGAFAGELPPASQVTIGFRDGAAHLAQLEGETFYRRIREKFGRLAH